MNGTKDHRDYQNCSRREVTAWLCGLAALALTSLAQAKDVLELVTRLDHPGLTEVSGMTSSGWPNTFWLHNDSGDEARLFAINSAGEILLPGYLASRYQSEPWPGLKILNAWNVDWEDITRAPDGTLFVTDLGNNGNARRDLGIYVLAEPNPLAIAQSRALTFLPVRYPDQAQFPAKLWHFDCEAVFYADGSLYLLTKHRKPGEIAGWETGSKLYRLDTHFSDRDNVVTEVSQSPELALATAADLSPDQQHLAVLTYLGVWLYRKPTQGDDWLSGPSRFISLSREQLKTSEALTWSSDQSLMIANEEGELLRLTLDSLP
jgi:hypothetical protein